MSFPGSLCIYTVVSGDYKWWIPLFRQRIKKEIPEAIIEVRVRSGDDNYPEDGYTTAAMRFLDSPLIGRECDYCLITDIDILMMAETPGLVFQHMRELTKHDLECYSNYYSHRTGQDDKVPGVHFVTRDWWQATLNARLRYTDDLAEHGSHSWEWDEVMLGRIIRESGLPSPPHEQFLWFNHGVHLGDWRRSILEKRQMPKMSPDQQAAAARWFVDKEFVEIVNESAEHYPIIGIILEKVKQSIGL
jgi:hypothetical protein